MRELFPIDIKKLNREDRQFLLGKNSSEDMFNRQMMQQNIILIVSMFALLTSLIAIILPLQFISTPLKTFVVIFFIIVAVYLIYTFVRSLRNIQKQLENIKQGYDELFKYHFAYAKQSYNKELKND